MQVCYAVGRLISQIAEAQVFRHISRILEP